MGFVMGCCNRINDRLNELVAKSEEHANVNANALMVIKDQLIERKMNELGLKLKDGRSRRSRTNRDAYGAGAAAGDRASFGRPMGGQGGMKQIGRG